MGWKDLSYWLRGLIWGIIVAVVISLIILVSFSLFFKDNELGFIILLIPAISITSIVLGLIMGTIIGATKSKKENIN